MPELHQNPAKPAQAKRPLEPITPHRVALAFLLCQVLGDTEDEYSSVFLTEIYKIVTAELFEVWLSNESLRLLLLTATRRYMNGRQPMKSSTSKLASSSMRSKLGTTPITKLRNSKGSCRKNV